jgi:hypothetical protein
MVFHGMQRNIPLDDELFSFNNAQRWDLFSQ